ncbi:similar to Saccharomyces cerevisiae YNR045W PET494 Mitochondrial translational activator specific for the COX3 mRNA, acts together with Pet54p and Pet122p [Maudiozyma saulgeensis]|uniref:Similar to Saccharomyces cerevisiae YNR045W PET494 Mitochondrial translational activator specific for the COX3 mRNA, acts together with Pet54p and Pet122p n=1 Tax=Maudiozyma saulgeensis TaxID=1789683 RepID=A0A1X7R7M2_9SACH|nr:similar to Saccharomyces cerevisiae YNR045W PET494 Mitochondrial translational activator specific for the COX3 mRNA, acts together with Pet54p and Pet122p [Kazachstania saulgeensis]
MFSRNRTNGSWTVIRLSLQRFHTTNRYSYFKQLKVRLRDSEGKYIRSLKRNTTSMVSVLRNGNQLSSPLNKGFGNTLWRYFNSPFNVVFMTTNIFAFAGIVAFSTLIDIRHLHNTAKIENNNHNHYGQEHQLSSSDNYVLANPSNVRRHMYPMITTLTPSSLGVPELPIDITDESISARQETQDKTLEMLERKVSEKTKELEEMEASTPLKTYTVDDIEVNSKNKRVVDFNSTKIKAALFNMMYSFKIYEDIIIDTQSNKTHHKSWFEELLHFRNKQKDSLATDSSKIGSSSFRPTVTNFYDTWRSEYQKIEPQDGQIIENFTLPNWSQYPLPLKDSCNKLYENKMGGIDDFKSFYNSIKSNKFKKLIRMWYYDNYKMIKSPRSNDPKVMAQRETFYNELLKDSIHDPPTFVKYASIVLNPCNPRKDMLFNKIKLDDNQMLQNQGSNIPVVQIETILNILQGYLTLQEEKKRTKILNYNDTYLRIVHMIKENGYLTEQGNIGIQLCPDDQVIYSHRKWLSKNRQDPKLYDELGKDPRVLQLLSQISS